MEGTMAVHLLLFSFFSLFFTIPVNHLGVNSKCHILVENHSPNFASSYHHKKLAHVYAPAPSVTVHGHKHNKTMKSFSCLFVGFVVGFGSSAPTFILLPLLVLKFVTGNGKGNRKGPCPTTDSPFVKKTENLAFLEKEATLASMELIGKGGYGEVYEAELPGSNGKMMAIKKVILPLNDTPTFLGRIGKMEFEIKTVGQIRHRNLMSHLAYLSKPDCYYFVYEFMKNGSLDDMFKKVEMGEMELDWLSRHKTAIGIAVGLEYLYTSYMSVFFTKVYSLQTFSSPMIWR